MSSHKDSPPRWAKQLDPKQLHRTLSDLGLSIPEQETRQHQIGAGTTEAIRHFQTDHGLKPTGTLDAATDKAIKDSASHLPPPRKRNRRGPLSGKYVVRGTVGMSEGEPLVGLLVKAFDQDVEPEDPLGQVITDDNGTYEITYTTAQFRRTRSEVGGPDLMVRAYSADGKVLAKSRRKRGAKPVEVVNLVVAQPQRRVEGHLALDTGCLAQESPSVSIAATSAVVRRCSARPRRTTRGSSR
jgi:putative peptidoglycan binding protein